MALGKIKVKKGFVDLGNERATKKILVKKKKRLKKAVHRAMPLP